MCECEDTKNTLLEKKVKEQQLSCPSWDICKEDLKIHSVCATSYDACSEYNNPKDF